MDYWKIYNSLCSRAKTRDPDGYAERHHVVPKCIGGSDCKTNLVLLYPEEHLLAHILLVKLYPEEPKLISAVARMCGGTHRWKGRRRRRLYGWLRRRHQRYMKTFTSDKNSQFGTMWICNSELRQNKKIPKQNGIPPGWMKGRNAWKRQYTCFCCKSVCFAPSESESKTRVTCGSKICLLKSRQQKYENKDSTLNKMKNNVDWIKLIDEHGSLSEAIRSLGFPPAGGWWYCAKQALESQLAGVPERPSKP